MNDEILYAKPPLDELALEHFGVKGMKWGVRRDRDHRRSTSLRGAVARRQNKKVDQGFRKWKENAAKREDAINLGKKANEARIKAESTKSKSDRKAAKSARRDYKKALRSNTTYRKGQVRSEVGKDLSRRYYNQAKSIKKQIDGGSSDKKLVGQYDKLMNKYDIERARARRAPEVAAKRSAAIAGMRRARTMAIKGAAASALMTGGLYVANKYGGLNLSAETVSSAIKFAKKAMRYI